MLEVIEQQENLLIAKDAVQALGHLREGQRFLRGMVKGSSSSTAR
jgi:hypothetical protein